MNDPGREARAAEPADRGTQAREQLIAEARRIFAAKGYAAASTREICEAAGANVAAIRYYFGGKEGLYRAVLLQPIEAMTGAFGDFDDPALSLEQAMRMFLGPLLAPWEGGHEQERQVLRLHLREMLEPSSVFREITDRIIAPVHNRLCAVLARHCDVERADTDLRQLAFAIAALANDYCLSREFMSRLAPDVLERPDAAGRILDRLVEYARALVDSEIARRRRPTPRGGTTP